MASIHTYIRTYIHTLHSYIRTLHTYIHAYIHTNTHTYITYIHAYVHAYIHYITLHGMTLHTYLTYIHTYIHACMHAYIALHCIALLCLTLPCVALHYAQTYVRIYVKRHIHACAIWLDTGVGGTGRQPLNPAAACEAGRTVVSDYHLAPLEQGCRAKLYGAAAWCRRPFACRGCVKRKVMSITCIICFWRVRFWACFWVCSLGLQVCGLAPVMRVMRVMLVMLLGAAFHAASCCSLETPEKT